jgi:TfoX/Sxy family transcriptional regulator of competence genes
MFGNLGAFVTGNMFMGLFGFDIGVKLPAAEVEKLVNSGGRPFGPTERPMSGYVSLPIPFTSAKAKPWIAKSLDYVGALPPKKAKPSKKQASDK